MQLWVKTRSKTKTEKAKSIARIVTAIETAGSGVDDKVCINFAKFLKHFMYMFLYNNEIIFDFVNCMGQKTALGSLLKAIGNSGQGKLYLWGAVPIMTIIGLLLLVFLVILLQIYNQSLLLQGFSVDWNGN